ncbi:MAG TPA: YciI family protein [Longimicrobium sp.]|nr:YciI family protein [Longimicrobium sp.]
MKYLLMINVPYAAGEYEGMPPDDWRAHLDYLTRMNRGLTASGELAGVQALAPPGQAKVVRAGKDGRAVITDGPFPEAKEFLAGFWMVDVNGPERAYQIAAQGSAAPGPGGAPLNMPIEVRQVMSGPPSDG